MIGGKPMAWMHDDQAEILVYKIIWMLSQGKEVVGDGDYHEAIV